jgi:hypothetical protein
MEKDFPRAKALERYIGSMKKSLQRYYEPGEIHEEQVIMSVLGVGLSRRRDVTPLSVIADAITKLSSGAFTPSVEDLELGEQGLLNPMIFFDIIPYWAKILHYDYQSEQQFAEYLQQNPVRENYKNYLNDAKLYQDGEEFKSY